MSGSDSNGQFDTTSTRTGIPFDELVAIYVLESVPQFGPKKFQSVFESGASFLDIIKRPEALPGKGKRIEQLRSIIGEYADKLFEQKSAMARRQLEMATSYQARILNYSDPDYPPNVYNSNNPVPLLYTRGNTSVLRSKSVVACVGSREIREPYSTLHRRFVASACEKNFVVASGFALGADTLGHRTAFERLGQTICVMPGGLQKPFPPENRDLWESLLNYPGAVFVTEFPFGLRASALTLRKRNKLIVASALGVLVSQSSEKGGAMNAFRFAIEQKKPAATFESEPSTSTEPWDATSGNAHIAGFDKSPTKVFSANPTVDSDFYQWLSKLS